MITEPIKYNPGISHLNIPVLLNDSTSETPLTVFIKLNFITVLADKVSVLQQDDKATERLDETYYFKNKMSLHYYVVAIFYMFNSKTITRLINNSRIFVILLWLDVLSFLT